MVIEVALEKESNEDFTGRISRGRKNECTEDQATGQKGAENFHILDTVIFV